MRGKVLDRSPNLPSARLPRAAVTGVSHLVQLKIKLLRKVQEKIWCLRVRQGALVPVESVNVNGTDALKSLLF